MKLADPEKATKFPPDYLEAVKKMHSEGGFGSLGQVSFFLFSPSHLPSKGVTLRDPILPV